MMNTKKIAGLSLLVIFGIGNVSATPLKKYEHSDILAIIKSQMNGATHLDTPNQDSKKKATIEQVVTKVLSQNTLELINDGEFLLYKHNGTEIKNTGRSLAQGHINIFTAFAVQKGIHSKIVDLESQKQLALKAQKSAEDARDTAKKNNKSGEDSFFPQGIKGYGFSLLVLALGGAVTFVVLQSMGDKTEDNEEVQQEEVSG